MHKFIQNCRLDFCAFWSTIFECPPCKLRFSLFNWQNISLGMPMCSQTTHRKYPLLCFRLCFRLRKIQHPLAVNAQAYKILLFGSQRTEVWNSRKSVSITYGTVFPNSRVFRALSVYEIVFNCRIQCLLQRFRHVFSDQHLSLRCAWLKQ